jgi:hypothetical protein
VNRGGDNRPRSRRIALAAARPQTCLEPDMTHRGVAAVVLLVAACTIVLEAKTKIQKDEKFDFTRIKTWDWSPTGAGEVKIIITQNSKSEPVKRQYEPVIMKAVEDQFAARGYERSTATKPDFHVMYFVLVTVGSTSQYMGQFLPSYAQWGIPMFSPQTSALEVYPQGALLIDAKLPDAPDMIWRGMAEAKVETEISEAKRAARLQGFIKDLISKFPKRPGKE